LLIGSADLTGNTGVKVKSVGAQSKQLPTGQQVYFGIREHAMGAAMVGMALHGGSIPVGGTFFVFADYMRPAIRLAALSKARVIFVFTHDSVGVGEDGPTHQPVEATSGLRIIPNLDVIRPADPEEVAGAFAASIEKKNGPTALIFSRQNVRTLSEISVKDRREGTLKGGYVALKETAPLTHILMGAGSELQWAMDAAKTLGPGVRVVSMPCFERFDRQSDEYKKSVLPSTCTKRLAIEAGVTGLWWKYVGLDGKVLGTDKFGFSAPGDTVMAAFGMNAANVVNVAKTL
jgi:transketolase